MHFALLLLLFVTSGLVPWALDAWSSARATEAAESAARYHFQAMVAEVATAQSQRLLDQLPLVSWLAEPAVAAAVLVDARGTSVRQVTRTGPHDARLWDALWSANRPTPDGYELHKSRAPLCLGRDLRSTRLGICYDLRAAVRAVRGDRGISVVRILNLLLAVGAGSWWYGRRAPAVHANVARGASQQSHLAPTPDHWHWALHAADIVPHGVLVFDVGLRLTTLNAEARAWFNAAADGPRLQLHAVDVAAALPWGELLLVGLEQVVSPGPVSLHQPRDAISGLALSIARLEGEGTVYGYWVMGVTSA
ncbi:MAG: hypothetical protein HY696_09315 [Deltaproteobacteria bacterium]|nr:hypothetical protein [Deltaproteobacteria bacterium]